MPGKPPWLSAFCRRNVDVKISRILATKCDPLPIWREMRIRCLTLEAGEPASTAAGARYRPDVIGVSKGYLRRADCRSAQQPGLRVRRLCLRGWYGGDKTADRES